MGNYIGTNIRVQHLILSTTGSVPTIPSPTTIDPSDSRWKSTDILKGEWAHNIIDDVWYYRTNNNTIKSISFNNNGSGGLENRYNAVAQMIADQSNQTDKGFQYVADASADSSITSGYAYYEYLGTTNGNINDYKIVSKEEILGINPQTITDLVNDVNDIESDISDLLQDVIDIDEEKADKNNVLELDNSISFSPTEDYHPATRKFVVDYVDASGNSNNKGFFVDETALTTAHPVGEDGWFAILGSTDTFWIWDEDTEAWVDSATAAPDLSAYALKSDTRTYTESSPAIVSNQVMLDFDGKREGEFTIATSIGAALEVLVSNTTNAKFAFVEGIYTASYPIDLSSLFDVGGAASKTIVFDPALEGEDWDIDNGTGVIQPPTGANVHFEIIVRLKGSVWTITGKAFT